MPRSCRAGWRGDVTTIGPWFDSCAAYMYHKKRVQIKCWFENVSHFLSDTMPPCVLLCRANHETCILPPLQKETSVDMLVQIEDGGVYHVLPPP
jgi:hypothetical protein